MYFYIGLGAAAVKVKELIVNTKKTTECLLSDFTPYNARRQHIYQH